MCHAKINEFYLAKKENSLLVLMHGKSYKDIDFPFEILQKCKKANGNQEKLISIFPVKKSTILI